MRDFSPELALIDAVMVEQWLLHMAAGKRPVEVPNEGNDRWVTRDGRHRDGSSYASSSRTESQVVVKVFVEWQTSELLLHGADDGNRTRVFSLGS